MLLASAYERISGSMSGELHFLAFLAQLVTSVTGQKQGLVWVG